VHHGAVEMEFGQQQSFRGNGQESLAHELYNQSRVKEGAVAKVSVIRQDVSTEILWNVGLERAWCGMVAAPDAATAAAADAASSATAFGRRRVKVALGSRRRHAYANLFGVGGHLLRLSRSCSLLYGRLAPFTSSSE
jgi:hypothetical protein